MKQCYCGFTEFQVVIEENVVKLYCVQCNTVYFHNARYIWQDNEIADLPDTKDNNEKTNCKAIS